jgi:hypothetical protein
MSDNLNALIMTFVVFSLVYNFHVFLRLPPIFFIRIIIVEI